MNANFWKQILDLGFSANLDYTNSYVKASKNGDFDTFRFLPEEELFNLYLENSTHEAITANELLQLIS